jgi:hypothetical protein
MKRVLLATAAILVLCPPAFAQTPAPEAPKTDVAKTDKADKPKWDVRDPPGYTLDLKLDVREGSWMALDVSPDGKEVVFDLMGDLYVMPITGGEARHRQRRLVGHAAQILARRQADRLHLRPGRRRQPLGHEP